MLEEVTRWATIIRDVGLIIGIPTIIVVGMKMYGLQLDALKHQNALLKETQYDRALSALGLPAAPAPQQNSRYRMQKLPLSKRAIWRSAEPALGYTFP